MQKTGLSAIADSTYIYVTLTINVYSMKEFFTLLFLTALCGSGHAQSYTLQSNQVKATILANGGTFTDGTNGAFIPVQPGLQPISLLNGSGIWIAGFDGFGNLKGAVDRISSTDFQPGELDPVDPSQVGNLVQIWPVTCSDIEAQQQDYSDNGVIDNPNTNIFAFPGKGNNQFEQYNGPGIDLPFTNQGLAAYNDLNEQGLYDPLLGEYPAIEIRSCPLTFPAREMAWSVFNDALNVPHPSGMAKLDIEVQRQVFQMGSLHEDVRDKTVFVKYKLINRGADVLDSCFVGLYSDLSIGNPGDDYIGTMPDRKLVIAYNGDENDEGGFGTAIPALGIKLLRAPLAPAGEDMYEELGLHSTLSIDDPSNLNSAQIYNLLNGRLPDGSAGPVGGFAFPGNPGQANQPGTELALGNVPGKRRSLMSMGPFTLYPGAVNELIVAYYYSYEQGPFTVPEQVVGLIEWGDVIDVLFDNCLEDGGNSCDFITEAPEKPNPSGLMVYPNPASGQFTVESKGVAFSRIEMVDALGRTVREIHLPAPALKYGVPVNDLAVGMYFVRIDGYSIPLAIQR
jgi:hypothetical protein